MRYRVLQQLERTGGRALCTVEAPAPPGSGAEVVGHVTGHVELTNAGVVVTARGGLSAVVRLTCSRCLTPYELPLQIEVQEPCTLRQIDDPDAYDADDEDEPIPIADGDEVDLSELVRQLLSVSLPLQPLCQAECRGLCPSCGADLNRQVCTCSTQKTDPRWAALARLRER